MKFEVGQLVEDTRDGSIVEVINSYDNGILEVYDSDSNKNYVAEIEYFVDVYPDFNHIESVNGDTSYPFTKNSTTYDVYMCNTDASYHIPDDFNGINIYFSEKSLRVNRKCVKECGVRRAKLVLEEE